jgi:UPF0042 nucleotide-binding protein
VRRSTGKLLAAPPANIAGKIEVRGIGILTLPARPRCRSACWSISTSTSSGCRSRATRMLIAASVPAVGLNALEPSAPIKVEVALARFGLPFLEEEPAPKRILLVTGLSGAGKSTALNTLEDLGWEVVDNLPLSLLEPPALDAARPRAGQRGRRPLAIGIDSRTRDFDAAGSSADQGAGQATTLPDRDLLPRLRRRRAAAPLFRDAPPPPAGARPPGDRRHRRRARADGAAAALGRPRHRHHRHRRQRAPAADPAALRRGPRAPTLHVMSFGFARGLPRNADNVFDMRFLKNPHWAGRAAPADRARPAVGDYIATDPAMRPP